MAEKAFKRRHHPFVAKATAFAAHESYNNDDDRHDGRHHGEQHGDVVQHHGDVDQQHGDVDQQHGGVDHDNSGANRAIAAMPLSGAFQPVLSQQWSK